MRGNLFSRCVIYIISCALRLIIITFTARILYRARAPPYIGIVSVFPLIKSLSGAQAKLIIIGSHRKPYRVKIICIEVKYILYLNFPQCKTQKYLYLSDRVGETQSSEKSRRHTRKKITLSALIVLQTWTSSVHLRSCTSRSTFRRRSTGCCTRGASRASAPCRARACTRCP
jgi:hypothetical protein